MSNEQSSGAAGGPKVELRATADGSPTLYRPDLNEHYHSTHGARQESAHVFIEAGLRPLLAAGRGKESTLRLLEVGLGTGLNALLTLEATWATEEIIIDYDGYETHPLAPDVVAALRPQWADKPALSQAYAWLHGIPWGIMAEFGETFFLTKIQEPVQQADLGREVYNLIYFDAFAPDKQPELWQPEVFERLYAAAAPGAVLVSYCAQGQFRRNLRAAGWRTERLPGPPGKREMTRATKPG